MSRIIPSSNFHNFPSFDFNGRVSSDLSLRHAWIQGQAPMFNSESLLSAITTNTGTTNPLNGVIDIVGLQEL